jgi:hypothetical protein
MKCDLKQFFAAIGRIANVAGQSHGCGSKLTLAGVGVLKLTVTTPKGAIMLRFQVPPLYQPDKLIEPGKPSLYFGHGSSLLCGPVPKFEWFHGNFSGPDE